jgi:L-rhamnose mutarotase
VNALERLCYVFELAPGQEEEYLRRHAEVWPEVIDAIKDAGFANYSLFKRGREVYAYAECEPDVATAMARLEATEVNARWSEFIRSVMVRAVDESGRLLVADEIWHLD